MIGRIFPGLFMIAIGSFLALQADWVARDGARWQRENFGIKIGPRQLWFSIWFDRVGGTFFVILGLLALLGIVNFT